MGERRTVEIQGTVPLDVPVARAVSYGSLVFVSGTCSMDMETGQLLLGSIEEETEQVLKNIEAILKEAGSSLNCVLKTTVFLTDTKYFDGMNRVFKRYFSEQKPARTTVGIQFPGDFKIEIEAIAYIPGK